MTTDIVTTQEGKKRLAELEEIAGENLHNSKEFFDNAMLALDEIRREKLWIYAVDEDGVMLADLRKARFKEDYLYNFCRRHGISPSSTYDHLGTVEVLHYLQVPDETIREIGVREAKPVRKLIDIDGRSNTVKLPPPEVIELLPPGDTTEERIRAKIEEVYINPPEPLSPADVFRSLAVDTGATTNIYVFQAGDGDIWIVGDDWDGVIIPKKNYDALHDDGKEWLTKKLKFEEYTKGE